MHWLEVRVHVLLSLDSYIVMVTFRQYWLSLSHFIYFVISFFRFLVREFVYDEQALEAGKNEITKLESDKKKQFVSSLPSSLAVVYLRIFRLRSKMYFMYGLWFG